MSDARREYICGGCYLFWSAPWDGTPGRPPCPACGTPAPHATDTFGCFYWEQDMARRHGDAFFRDNYWFCLELCDKEEADRLRAQEWRCEPVLRRRVPAPSPEGRSRAGAAGPAPRGSGGGRA